MSNRDRAVEVLDHHKMRMRYGTAESCACGWVPPDVWAWHADHRQHLADALVAAGLIHVGQGFCAKVPNCRLAEGHAAGCERT